ncbi:protein kinase [Nostoc linckia FACHB-391]|uniref:non-specific serine/threonine protein kinase n=2 Tax=Nostoc TaxID=1177 RepID=A0ABR8IIJ2_9NOSO|nr:protein kinase [Nostoc linckia]MBD2564917.1 protein kinase [Nostoc linckia FACHB-391]MBD2651395.1 protein kinase [Nostoc foliaceum FACHB-393]
MVYCINHLCTQRCNPDNVKNCLACGNSLLINGRIRLLRPLRSLEENLYTNTNVFEVEDVDTKSYPKSQIRVMKILKWSEPKLVELVQREARILQIIQYPGIPESARDDYFTFKLKDTLLELHCLVMQKVEGENLRQWLKSYGRIPQNVAFDWLSQLIDTLDVVHRSGFFHRDIKPENIIHKPDGKLVLIDFGAAREITSTYLAKVSTSGGSSTGLASGYGVTSVITAFFSPPEQMNGQAVPQSDFYALGRTFVNLVTGMSLMDLPTNEKTGRLMWRKYAPQIDKPFADLLDDLMASSPGQRPQSTQVILQRLNKLPYQSKIYKLIKSKKLLFSVLVTLITLGFFGGFKVFLPIMANNLVLQGKKSELANDSQTAQNYFNQAIEYNSQLQLSVSQFYLEQAARHFNDFKLAKRYYELALKYNNKDINAYNSLAVVCWQLGEVACALDNYQHILKLKPNDWEGYYRLGSFYDQEGKEDLAQEQYKIAIKINKKAVPALNDLSRLKNLKEDYTQATALALEGLRLTEEPKLQAALYKNLGWAKFMQNQYNEAEKYLQKASDLDSKRIDAVCLLAQVQEALGKIEDARLSWEICMLARTTQQDVFKWRQELLDRLTNNSKISQ